MTGAKRLKTKPVYEITAAQPEHTTLQCQVTTSDISYRKQPTYQHEQGPSSLHSPSAYPSAVTQDTRSAAVQAHAAAEQTAMHSSNFDNIAPLSPVRREKKRKISQTNTQPPRIKEEESIVTHPDMPKQSDTAQDLNGCGRKTEGHQKTCIVKPPRVGDIVWAKVQNHPAWPAQVCLCTHIIWKPITQASFVDCVNTAVNTVPQHPGTYFAICSGILHGAMSSINALVIRRNLYCGSCEVLLHTDQSSWHHMITGA